jgi:hypothetical protein
MCRAAFSSSDDRIAHRAQNRMAHFHPRLTSQIKRRSVADKK